MIYQGTQEIHQGQGPYGPGCSYMYATAISSVLEQGIRSADRSGNKFPKFICEKHLIIHNGNSRPSALCAGEESTNRALKCEWSRLWLRSLQVKAMHIKTMLINARNSAHDFSVKFSPCNCSSGWRNGCNLLAYIVLCVIKLQAINNSMLPSICYIWYLYQP